MGFFCGLPVCVPVRQRKKTGSPREGQSASPSTSERTWSTWSAVINLTSRAGELRKKRTQRAG